MLSAFALFQATARPEGFKEGILCSRGHLNMARRAEVYLAAPVGAEATLGARACRHNTGVKSDLYAVKAISRLSTRFFERSFLSPGQRRSVCMCPAPQGLPPNLMKEAR